MVAQPNTHVLTLDYRGFGKSTGSPTEAGLIIDGVTLVDWVLNVANIPPERIVILGQSLGTAVASAVGLQFAAPNNGLVPLTSGESRPLLRIHASTEPTTFAGIVLVAPFSSLPSLSLSYRIAGVFPLLLPLRPFPYLGNLLTSQVVDKWPTAERLATYSAELRGSPKLQGAGGRNMGSVQIIHAVNDGDITCRQTEMICQRMLSPDGEKCIDISKGAAILDVRRDGCPRVRFEIVEHGGMYACELI